MQTPRTNDEVIDHILKFDPEDSSTALKASSLQPALMEPRSLSPIPWPKGKGPIPQPSRRKPAPNKKLPPADVVVVTWTVAEALALSDVLTPGYRSKKDWYEYAHRWKEDFKPILKKGAPALIEDRLGLWFMTKIGTKKVLCLKSELHFCRDGSKMPIFGFWKQIIEEARPSLIITTGTAGGIGKDIVLGDVVVSKSVRFDCKKQFKNQAFAQKEYKCPQLVNFSRTAFANSYLMHATVAQLPSLKRQPKILTKHLSGNKALDVVTTDFFAFDDSTNYFGLQKLGSAVEMGDATLGYECAKLGKAAPAWVAIRNASDPQIDGSLPYKQQVEMAGRIYEKYGYWTTVNSAIACWAVISS